MFSPPPTRQFEASIFGNQKLDELLLSDSHMADGVEVTVVPSLPHSDERHSSTRPILTEECSWFFLSK